MTSKKLSSRHSRRGDESLIHKLHYKLKDRQFSSEIHMTEFLDAEIRFAGVANSYDVRSSRMKEIQLFLYPKSISDLSGSLAHFFTLIGSSQGFHLHNESVFERISEKSNKRSFFESMTVTYSTEASHHLRIKPKQFDHNLDASKKHNVERFGLKSPTGTTMLPLKALLKNEMKSSILNLSFNPRTNCSALLGPISPEMHQQSIKPKEVKARGC
jgi:hypothetical protein